MEMLWEVARSLLCKLFEKRLELCICHRARDSRFEPSHDEESARRIGRELEVQIDFAVTPGEARPNHSYDRVALVDQVDILADDAGIAVVVPLPELIAQHGYIFGILALGPIRWQQSTPQQRRHAEMDESVGSEIHSLNVFGKITFGGREAPPVHRGNAFDTTGLPKLLQLRYAEVHKEGVPPSLVNRQVYHAVGIVIQIRIHQHAVDHSEHVCSRSDALPQL